MRNNNLVRSRAIRLTNTLLQWSRTTNAECKLKWIKLLSCYTLWNSIEKHHTIMLDQQKSYVYRRLFLLLFAHHYAQFQESKIFLIRTARRIARRYTCHITSEMAQDVWQDARDICGQCCVTNLVNHAAKRLCFPRVHRACGCFETSRFEIAELCTAANPPRFLRCRLRVGANAIHPRWKSAELFVVVGNAVGSSADIGEREYIRISRTSVTFYYICVWPCAVRGTVGTKRGRK